jgi:hypothetical protein
VRLKAIIVQAGTLSNQSTSVFNHCTVPSNHSSLSIKTSQSVAVNVFHILLNFQDENELLVDNVAAYTTNPHVIIKSKAGSIVQIL